MKRLMKAYSIKKAHEIAVEEHDLPKPNDGEVLIRVSAIGICGSDAHLFKGTYNGPQNFPLLFGHEWSGYIEAIGSGVDELTPGDLVTGDCSRFCGSCANCRYDKNVCSTIEKFGITIDGASAEYIIRPSKYVYKAPDSINPKLLALTEPLAVSAHHIEKIMKLRLLDGKSSFLIFGAGGIGLGAYLLLKHMYGMKNVAVADISAVRLEAARQLGADIAQPGIMNEPEDGNTYASLYGSAAYDCIIDTTGSPKVFRRTIDLVRPLGVVGSIGMSTGSQIDQKKIVLKALTLVGSIGGTGEFPEVIKFIAEHEDKVSKLVSHEFTMEQVEEALELSTDSTKAVKVLLNMS